MKKPISKGDQAMINISACEFPEFSRYMIGQYGKQQFEEGFEIIKTNRSVLYGDDGEAKLTAMLGHLHF